MLLRKVAHNVLLRFFRMLIQIGDGLLLDGLVHPRSVDHSPSQSLQNSHHSSIIRISIFSMGFKDFLYAFIL
jgi:hypothetical protein